MKNPYYSDQQESGNYRPLAKAHPFTSRWLHLNMSILSVPRTVLRIPLYTLYIEAHRYNNIYTRVPAREKTWLIGNVLCNVPRVAKPLQLTVYTRQQRFNFEFYERMEALRCYSSARGIATAQHPTRLSRTLAEEDLTAFYRRYLWGDKGSQRQIPLFRTVKTDDSQLAQRLIA